MSGPPPWYAVCQAVLCGAAGWAVLGMYARGVPTREEASPPVRDPGLLWLGLAILTWAVVGALLIAGRSLVYLRPFLSVTNSAFLLLAATHLDYGPAFLRPLRDAAWWPRAVAGAALGVALATLGLDLWLGAEAPLAHVPDMLFSEGTLLLYGVGLYRSFRERRFGVLAWLAVVGVGLQSLAQLPEVYPGALDLERTWILNLASKAIVIVVYLSLAMTWAHEMARRRSSAGQRVLFTGLPGSSPQRCRVLVGDQVVDVRPACLFTFLSLAVARSRDPGGDGGWVSLLELSPSRSSVDFSRVRRLREDLAGTALADAIRADGAKRFRLEVAPELLAYDLDRLHEDPVVRAVVAPLVGDAARDAAKEADARPVG